MYLTHNEGKSVVVDRFIKILKSKIYKTFTANDSKFILGRLNKLVDEYNTTYRCSIGENPADVDYSGLTEKIELTHKAPKFKVGDRVRITKDKKTNPWTYKI